MRRHAWNAKVHRGNKVPRSMPQPPSLPWHREERPRGSYQRFLRYPSPCVNDVPRTQDTRGHDSQARPIFLPAGALRSWPWPASVQGSKEWPKDYVRTHNGGKRLSMNSPSRSRQRQASIPSKEANDCRLSAFHENAQLYFEQPEVVSAAVETLLGENEDELRRRSAACLLAAESATHR